MKALYKVGSFFWKEKSRRTNINSSLKNHMQKTWNWSFHLCHLPFFLYAWMKLKMYSDRFFFCVKVFESYHKRKSCRRTDNILPQCNWRRNRLNAKYDIVRMYNILSFIFVCCVSLQKIITRGEFNLNGAIFTMISNKKQGDSRWYPKLAEPFL